ncbi:hypothetical protein [uncultured Cohaesibacter sp.]|uniref:hypothetical protein n=1 Tax=uncultured Cohaesibacter sp. TaxID=1002546 RepID=UPI0029C7901B|nr:hypothetical protein [uncultured Cohaesibacter sp.]
MSARKYEAIIEIVDDMLFKLDRAERNRILIHLLSMVKFEAESIKDNLENHMAPPKV